MKPNRLGISGWIAIVILLLCCAIAISWMHSLHGHWTRSWTFRGSRYSVVSSAAMLVLYGPPTEGSDDPLARRLAEQMSNDDVLWNQPPFRGDGGNWFISGDLRPGSPTQEMHRHFRYLLATSKGLEPGERLWLAAMEDPRKFLPADMMLSLASGQRRGTRASDTGLEMITVPADPATGKPNLSDWTSRRDHWHERFDTPRRMMHYSILLALAWIVPALRFSRPARHSYYLRRRLLNAMAMFSIGVALIVTAQWIISYKIGEDILLNSQIVALPSSGPAAAGPGAAQAITFDWLRSAKGRVQWLSRTVPYSGRSSYQPVNGRSAYIEDIARMYPTRPVKFNRHRSIPGFSFYDQPAQTLPAEKYPHPVASSLLAT